jgi:hypothetical protein
VEINKDAFGDFFLWIPTSWLESTKRFPHLPTGPAAGSISIRSVRIGKHTCLIAGKSVENTCPGRRTSLAGFEVIIVGRF